MDIRLYTVHRIFIVSAAILGVLVGIWGLYTYIQSKELAPMVTGTSGCIVSLGLMWYFRRFQQKTKTGQNKRIP